MPGIHSTREIKMNNNTDKISITGRLKSIKHAVDGITELLKGQHNAWVHLIASFSIISFGFIFHINRMEWLFLVIAITLVWICEAFNTALEYLCDVASPDFHPLIKKSKDVAAGAVLLSSIGAMLIGLIVFLPYIVNDV